MVAESKTPRLAKTLKESGQFFCRTLIVACARCPKQRINHIPSHHDKVGVRRLHNLFNCGEGPSILSKTKDTATDVNVGQLQDSKRSALFLYYGRHNLLFFDFHIIFHKAR